MQILFNTYYWIDS